MEYRQQTAHCKAIYDYPLGYIATRVNGMQINMLVDSACTFATIDISVYRTLPQKGPLKPFNRGISAVNGQMLRIYGYTDVTMSVADGDSFPYELVVADIGSGEAIFGFNLMKKTKATLDIEKDEVRIKGRSYSYGPCIGQRVASLRCCKAVTVGPMQTVIVEAQVGQEWQMGQLGMVTSGQGKSLDVDDKGLLINPGLVCPDAANRVRVTVTNFSNQSRKVARASDLGRVEEVEEVYDFDEMKPNAPPEWAEVARVMSAVSRGQVSEAQAPEPGLPAAAAQSEEQQQAATILQGIQEKQAPKVPEYMQPLMDTLPDELNAVQRQQVQALLVEFQDVFTAPDGQLGQTKLVQHKINTGDHAPIKIPPRRAPMAMRVIYDEEVKKMLDQGVIEPSTSAWASPVVLVKKKDGTYRFCVDYRRLNDITKKDAYPLPRLDDSVEAMAGAEWFHTLDLHSGYWQVEMDPEDKEKTAFVTRSGLYQFRVMPFGLTNAPATFERLMEMVLNGLQWEQLQVYLDDVIVFGRTFMIAMLNLILVFLRFRQANLKMKVKKCKLFQSQVSFLGHIVSREGVKCDPAKLEAVAQWPHPETVTEVKSFLGFCTYYRRFIAHFSTVASPLTRLTRKDVDFVWTDKCEQAFRQLKYSLMTAPVLAYPQMGGQFILDTDASNTGIGAVLSQVQDGEEKVVGYASKTLSKTERNYCTTYKELLAVVKFCKHFKSYLWGQPFTVRTDHASLVWLINFKGAEGMLARWLSTLSEYQIEAIQHRPGIRHVNADVLSRMVPKRVCPRLDCPCCQPVRESRQVQKSSLDAVAKSGRTGDLAAKPDLLALPGVSQPGQAYTSKPPVSERPLATKWDSFGGARPKVRPLSKSGPRIAAALGPSEQGKQENQPGASVVCPGEEKTATDQARDAQYVIAIQIKKAKARRGPEHQRRSRCRQKLKHAVPARRELFKRKAGQDKVSVSERACNTLPDEGVQIKIPKTQRIPQQNEQELNASDLPSPGDQNEKTRDLTLPAPAQCDRARASAQQEQELGTWIECQTMTDWANSQAQDEAISQIIHLMDTYSRRPAWKTLSVRSPELKAYWTLWDRLFIKEGVLMRRELKKGADVEPAPRLVAPVAKRKELMTLLHNHKMAGHLGTKKTYSRVKRRFYWPGCKRDVYHWCQKCHTCAMIKPGGEKKKAPLVQQLSGAPLERLAIDLVGPLPRTPRNAAYILVCSDYFTKFTEAYPLTSKNTQEVAEKLVTEWFCRYGVPRQLHSDQGKEFTSKVITDICQCLNIDKTRTTPYRPSSDGLVERNNRTLQQMLKAFVNQNRTDWDQALPYVMMAYRSTAHESTGCSPNSLMFGREVETPLDVQYVPRGSQDPHVVCHVEYADYLRELMRRGHEVARTNLGRAAERQRRNYDHGAHARVFKVGNWVYLRDFVSSHTKLGLNWKGPYLIVGRPSDVTLTIQKSETSKTKVVHMDHVKQCLGDHPDTWVSTEIAAAGPEMATLFQPAEPIVLEESSEQDISTQPSLQVPGVMEETNEAASEIPEELGESNENGPQEMLANGEEMAPETEPSVNQPEKEETSPKACQKPSQKPPGSGLAEEKVTAETRTRYGRTVRAPERLIDQM